MRPLKKSKQGHVLQERKLRYATLKQAAYKISAVGNQLDMLEGSLKKVIVDLQAQQMQTARLEKIAQGLARIRPYLEDEAKQVLAKTDHLKTRL